MSLTKLAASIGRFLFPKAGKNAPEEVVEEIANFRAMPLAKRAEQPLLYHLLGTGTYDYKFSKPDVHYTDKSPNPIQKCSNCHRSYQHVSSKRFICDWVTGDIKPAGWCDRWVKG